MKFKKLSLAVGAMTLLPMSVVVSCNKKTDEQKTIENLSRIATEVNKARADKQAAEDAKKAAEDAFKKLVDKDNPSVITSEKSIDTINSLINLVKAEKTANPSITKNELIVKITDKLMNKEYVGNRLIGSENIPEQLVADIEHLDCFTFLDYVNALLDATSFSTFLTNLKATRYNDSEVQYTKRKHFFTDWEYGTPIVKNLVAEKANDPAFADKVVKVVFNKNGKRQEDGTLKEILKGVPIVENREVTYLKVDAITDEFMSANFKDGDLIMLAAPASLNDWLDVTHCGYLVFKDGKAMYRNASSKKTLRKVADINLVDYLTDRNFNSKEGKPYETPKVPGILVYRTI
ncbi:N-acetylmuramoyl-L-alanine amidase-like domain-containing protein [Mycoplasmopsis lipofaciens]|uniref:N-acetylmuramoyl-L-alanine amidase-like domain-containing protein n=1 Tax=Mycoplasmopsis lipofaciens TaxID=114884 RepID=UPI0004834949|nr:N-acetylmuramoyl-L-alanine amidase-like domain-containing protein [Mycoplasmopsis lipofaciens]